MATRQTFNQRRAGGIPIVKKERVVSEQQTVTEEIQQASTELQQEGVQDQTTSLPMTEPEIDKDVSAPTLLGISKWVPKEEPQVIKPEERVVVKEKPKAAIFEYRFPEDIQSFLEEIHGAGSDADMIPFQLIASYLKAMEPGKAVNADIGCRQQVNFLRALTTTLSDPTDLFRPKWTAIIRIYKHYLNQHFHPHYEARFVESVPMTADDHRFWLALLTLLRHSATAEDLSTISRHCSFERVFAKNAEFKSRIEEYYGTH